MTAITAPRPLAFAGFPVASWIFAIRIWIAILFALYAGFWLQLESTFSAAITVAILALPTRGQALEKAASRLIGTIIGVIAAIVIVGAFAQLRDLLLLAFAAWIGLCVYAGGLSDGNRSYAAVLAGYTMALLATQQIDAPLQVFDAGVQRGVAIALGVGAVALVNDLLGAPDRHVGLAAQLADLHRRVRDAADAVATIGLLREIAAQRAEISSLATESGDGRARTAAARSVVVSLVAQLHAALVVRALSAAPDAPEPAQVWASGELARRDQAACEALAALAAGTPPPHAWRTPFYSCHRVAAAAGLRAVLWTGLASSFFVLAGWPAADSSLALFIVVIGLGSTMPDPQRFTVLACIAAPIATVLAGVLEFLILDGATQFQLLALALAPFVIGLTLLMTHPNLLLSGLGRLTLVFLLAILQPSNPQTYDPQAYLFISLFLCLSTGLLLAAQLLIPPLSAERRRQGLLASARRELAHFPSAGIRALAPEEAMFRDTVRIGQIAGMGAPDPQQPAALDEALTLFVQSGMQLLCDARLRETSNGTLQAKARRALAARDADALQRLAAEQQDDAATSAVLYAAGVVMRGRAA